MPTRRGILKPVDYPQSGATDASGAGPTRKMAEIRARQGWIGAAPAPAAVPSLHEQPRQVSLRHLRPSESIAGRHALRLTRDPGPASYPEPSRYRDPRLGVKMTESGSMFRGLSPDGTPGEKKVIL